MSAAKIVAKDNLLRDQERHSDNANRQAELRVGAGSRPDKPDVAALMLEIRRRVKADIEANKDRYDVFRGYKADHDGNASRKAGELLHSQDLLFLNRHYQFGYRPRDLALTSSLPWPLGKLVIWLKQKIIALREFFLRDYLAAERDFHANLVRYLNDVSKYVDARDFSCFWEIIRKIDYDITKALERIERIGDDAAATTRSSEKRILDEVFSNFKELQGVVTGLQGNSEQHHETLKRLDSVVLGLESILARQGSNKASSPTADQGSGSLASTRAVDDTDYSYLLLENRFRGSEHEIASRLAIYPPLFANAKKPVLEIGAGRGELQELFRSQNIPARGVDIDRAMVDLCSAKGLDVKLVDGLEYLRAQPDESLGGVIAVQVVEHLSRTQLEELFRLCAIKVEAAGKVVFETINPQSLLALSSNYFRDPTHVWPLHPDLLSYMMELSGLHVVETKYLSPVAREAELRPIPIAEHMTPRWAFTAQVINNNIAQLNKLLYGYQDYCLVAEVRG